MALFQAVNQLIAKKIIRHAAEQGDGLTLSPQRNRRIEHRPAVEGLEHASTTFTFTRQKIDERLTAAQDHVSLPQTLAIVAM
jgi:hypothetical protein